MITIDVAGVKELEKALGDDAKSLPKYYAQSVNKTTTGVVKEMSIGIREHLNVKSATVKNHLKRSKPASKNKLGTWVNLAEENRLPLGEFGARQIASGVSYKINPGKGTTKIKHAFMGPRPGVKEPKLGGHVWRRLGKSRYPKAKLMGASPWGAYVKNKMNPKIIRYGQARLEKEIRANVKYRLLKRQGLAK